MVPVHRRRGFHQYHLLTCRVDGGRCWPVGAEGSVGLDLALPASSWPDVPDCLNHLLPRNDSHEPNVAKILCDSARHDAGTGGCPFRGTVPGALLIWKGPCDLRSQFGGGFSWLRGRTHTAAWDTIGPGLGLTQDLPTTCFLARFVDVVLGKLILNYVLACRSARPACLATSHTPGTAVSEVGRGRRFPALVFGRRKGFVELGVVSRRSEKPHVRGHDAVYTASMSTKTFWHEMSRGFARGRSRFGPLNARNRSGT
jgi:hypothetical protein